MSCTGEGLGCRYIAVFFGVFLQISFAMRCCNELNETKYFLRIVINGKTCFAVKPNYFINIYIIWNNFATPALLYELDGFFCSYKIITVL